jgi:5'-phosphate synthase pdxT subunit
MLQGARNAHIASLKKASEVCGIRIQIQELRKSSDLQSSHFDAIILPGGESTSMRLTGNSPVSQLLPSLLEWIRQRPLLPVLGTCAGAILLADPQDGQSRLIDTTINRNAYGRQIDSFQAAVQSSLLSRNFSGIFIRAPKFNSKVDAENIVATCNGDVVGVRKINRIALTFHPELSGDTGFHQWIIEKANTLKEESD